MLEKQVQSFYELKLLVLKKYQEKYPFVKLDWKTFSSKDIEQLILDVEEKTKNKISEKWVYTHLKSKENSKLPRKDMLDILSIYCGFSSWDEFIFQKSVVSSEIENKSFFNKKILFILILLLLLTFSLISFVFRKDEVKKSVKVKEYYSGNLLKDTIHRFYKKSNNEVEFIDLKNDKLSSNDSIFVESPFYKEAKVHIENDEKVIFVKPVENALILKAYLKADIKDWDTRKQKLDKILSDELEVMLYLPNMLGIEYMNKEEFSQKLIVPTSSVKKWEIIHIEETEQGIVSKIRLKQN